jgi:hypothetical protein
MMFIKQVVLVKGGGGRRLDKKGIKYDT